MKIWENGIIRDMTPEEEAICLEAIASLNKESSNDYELYYNAVSSELEDT